MIKKTCMPQIYYIWVVVIVWAHIDYNLFYRYYNGNIFRIMKLT